MGVDFYDVYLELEEEFDIRFLDDAMSLPVWHVGELYDVILAALRVQHAERFITDPCYAEKVWEHYKGFFVYQFDLDPKQVVKSAHFVQDLKLY
jgi:hypothetical protein